MSQKPKIEVDWESFENVEYALRRELERLMSLPNKNAPTIQKAIDRRKNALHQLLEWKDFLKNPQYYSDERGERMKQLLDRLTTFDKRERVRRIELGLIKITPISHYRDAVRLKSEYKRKEKKIVIEAEYGLNGEKTLHYYFD